jgi:serine protease Do
VMRDKQERTLNITVDELDLEAEGSRRARRDSGDAAEETQGFGITLNPLTSDVARRLRVPPDTEGVLVADVEQGSPASRAGIVRGDVILQVNRKPVASPPEASRALGAVPSGSTAFLLILRNGQQQFVTVRKE